MILNYYHPLCIARATAVSTQKQSMFYRFIGENHCFPFIYGVFLYAVWLSQFFKEMTNFKRNCKQATVLFQFDPCILSFPQLDKEKTKISRLCALSFFLADRNKSMDKYSKNTWL